MSDNKKIKETIYPAANNVSPRAIIEYARDPESELHKCFEWNDVLAADMYRLHQAVELLENLAIEVTD